MEKQIILSSHKHIVTGISKKSSGQFWKDVQIGHELQFSVCLDAVGRGRGLYATYFTVRNLTNGTQCIQSSNQMAMPLSRLTLRELV